MLDYQVARAVEITGHTLIGVSRGLPHKIGNCFSMKDECGEEYRIVNFIYENLLHLIKSGLTFPIRILVLSANIAVIHDKRIPTDWYNVQFCEVCCPDNLLPLPQILRHERETMQGIRRVNGDYVCIYFCDPDCIIKPNIAEDA